ncbi:MAG: type IV toxin-antitoxin system AbiEi family antitoxin domain-containing protein [Planctomycetes bacterium]|nr:type IV toxin-antitoxin system AbiEi family antitoxin domain-containing protein [Planctomycetota bacterium]
MTRSTCAAPGPGTLGLPAFFRPQDLAARGVAPDTVVTWVRQGQVVRVDRGIYRVVDYEATELETIAQVTAAVPHGVLCLLSALRFHEIGTQSPPVVWMAIPRGSRAPRVRAVAVKYVAWTPTLMAYGVEARVAQGVPFRVTSPARTVVDCFRRRRMVGLAVAMEALSDAIRSRKASVADILSAADVVHVGRSIEPYLEAVLA